MDTKQMREDAEGWPKLASTGGYSYAASVVLAAADALDAARADIARLTAAQGTTATTMQARMVANRIDKIGRDDGAVGRTLDEAYACLYALAEQVDRLRADIARLTADLEIQRDMSDGAVRVAARLTASLTAAEGERDEERADRIHVAGLLVAVEAERDSLAARVAAMLAECEKQARIDDATTKAKANAAAAIALHGKGE